MGQILNRVKNIAKAYKSSHEENNFYFDNNDDELKRIIDEFNSSGEKKQTADGRQQTGRREQGEGKKEKGDGNQLTIESAYKILKIDKNAGQDEIKKAYLERIKEYHPDRLENFGDDLKELAKKKTQEINQAYSLLKERHQKTEVNEKG